MTEAEQDGDWVFSEVGRTYRDEWFPFTGRVHGYTLHMQMMWVPRNATYCFWLGKDGEPWPPAPTMDDPAVSEAQQEGQAEALPEAKPRHKLLSSLKSIWRKVAEARWRG